jgi:mRNA deadenylase 3'-5' endonuclease subunit Ccr4
MYPNKDRKKHNIAQILHFNNYDMGQDSHYLVVNSHLHYDPKDDIIKYAQMAYLLNETNLELENIKEKFQIDDPIPVFMVGDFNSRPESVLYSMIKHGLPVTAESLSKDLDVQAKTNKEFANELLKQR